MNDNNDFRTNEIPIIVIEERRVQNRRSAYEEVRNRRNAFNTMKEMVLNKLNEIYIENENMLYIDKLPERYFTYLRNKILTIEPINEIDFLDKIAYDMCQNREKKLYELRFNSIKLKLIRYIHEIALNNISFDKGTITTTARKMCESIINIEFIN